MTRKELQNLALSLMKQNNRVALQWCTSLGKSKAAIIIMNHLIKTTKNPINILLIVAESAHKANWETEFKRWKLQHCSITIECYASLKKYKDTQWNLIIFDEAHHLGSDLRLDILTTITAKNILLLSATLQDKLIQVLDNIFGKFIISKITLQQAIEWNILPTPKIFLIPVFLDNIKKDCIITEEWGNEGRKTTYKCDYNDRWEYIRNKNKYPNVKLEIYCTQQQKYNYLSEQFEYWKNRFLRTRQDFAKNKWLQAGSKRKRFLGECKTKVAEILLSKIWKKRFICFCSSIEQAEVLGGKNAIHSKKNDSLNIVDSFNNKYIDNIFAVGMLQEGQNLIDIDAGIIVQLDGQERSFIQKFGRSMRAEDPVQYIFYYKNTRDQEYLNKVLEGIDEEYITEITDLINLKV